MKRNIDFKKHTREELIELARDCNAGKVVGSWNILNLRLHPKKMGLVFRPVALAYGIDLHKEMDNNGDPRRVKKFELKRFKKGYPEAENVRHFYEYLDKAIEKNFRGSGLPMFTTCRALDADECITLASQMEIQAAQK